MASGEFVGCRLSLEIAASFTSFSPRKDVGVTVGVGEAVGVAEGGGKSVGATVDEGVGVANGEDEGVGVGLGEETGVDVIIGDGVGSVVVVPSTSGDGVGAGVSSSLLSEIASLPSVARKDGCVLLSGAASVAGKGDGEGVSPLSSSGVGPPTPCIGGFKEIVSLFVCGRVSTMTSGVVRLVIVPSGACIAKAKLASQRVCPLSSSTAMPIVVSSFGW